VLRELSPVAGSVVRTAESQGGQRGCFLKRLLRSYVEQGLGAASTRTGQKRSAATLPRLDGSLAIKGQQLSNAGLFDLLDP